MLFTVIAQVVELGCDLVELKLLEHCDDQHVVVDDGVCRDFDFGVRILDDPLDKLLSGDEGALRQGTDGLSLFAVELVQALVIGCTGILSPHDEGDRIVVVEYRV